MSTWLCNIGESEPSASDTEDPALLDWKLGAHRLQAESLARQDVHFSDRGLRDLGTLAEIEPPGSNTRPDYLEPGMMIAVSMQEQEHPLSVAKIITIFRDRTHSAHDNR